MQPKHERVDPYEVLLAAVRAATSEVVVPSREATYDGSETVSVLDVVSMRAIGGPWNRWAFDVDVQVATTGPTVLEAWDAHARVSDAILSLTSVNDVQFSSVRCDGEPLESPAHYPSGAAMVSSRYSLYVRRNTHG